jgi:hypothetical protein
VLGRIGRLYDDAFARETDHLRTVGGRVGERQISCPRSALAGSKYNADSAQSALCQLSAAAAIAREAEIPRRRDGVNLHRGGVAIDDGH